jgi:hypothetical protein
MTVSRWERSELQPSSKHLIKLGTLVQEDEDSFWEFWGRAGLTSEVVARVFPSVKPPIRTVPLIEIVAQMGQNIAGDGLVAISVLKIYAAAGKEKGSTYHDLRFARSQRAIAAPGLWCPNPKDTVCMIVKGDSMHPILHDGYLIVVDQKQNDKKALHGQIVVASHANDGLVVTRLWQLNGSLAMVSDNHRYDPIPWGPKWRIVGKVLWWIGLPSAENL